MAEETTRGGDREKRLRERQDAARRALATTDGTALLELLEERWYWRFRNQAADAAAANAGAWEVMAYLRRLRDRKEG